MACAPKNQLQETDPRQAEAAALVHTVQRLPRGLTRGGVEVRAHERRIGEESTIEYQITRGGLTRCVVIVQQAQQGAKSGTTVTTKTITRGITYCIPEASYDARQRLMMDSAPGKRTAIRPNAENPRMLDVIPDGSDRDHALQVPAGRERDAQAALGSIAASLATAAAKPLSQPQLQAS